MLRLVIAIVVCALYLAMVAVARPYNGVADHNLAITANLLLVCFFTGGMVLRLCEERRWSDTCSTFFGLDSAYNTSVFVVALTIAMLVVVCLVVASKAWMAVQQPIIRLASNDRPPVLSLPKRTRFHFFMSHVWSTGQDQVP